ncbi:glycosyltransferase family 4 protein [Prolixibacter sp. NT017]|uniref:glycosyltransferase family 4 protein n=1 Tax=Prolixibacter sp. NT017 TaxID=2652390 RepID=UPI0012790447|nr:glycosyltransferase family 4 protein [Prolixibacter sp. NT017]GET24470.1 hypothetical protein NT017_07990 [Prolixibacter sp. NT017]
MNIGIAGPIKVSSLKDYLEDLKDGDLELGLGGTAINILVKSLLEEGNKLTVFTLDPRVKEKYAIEGKNLKIIIGHFRTSNKKTLDFCYHEHTQIKRFIAEEKNNLDIVNAHWSYEYAIGAIRSGIPHVVTFRDNSPTILKLTKHPYRLTRLFMDFWVRKKARAICYNSQYLKDRIKRPGLIIPNPLSNNSIHTKRTYPGENHIFHIFFIANGWNKIKNPEAAISGFNKLKNEIAQMQLHLVGQDYEKDGSNYKTAQKKFNLNDIHFHGKVSHELLLKMLHDCDILLHTSREESFGNSLVEAMAQGIPVIGGKKSGAVPWLLNKGEAGLLVDVESPDEIFKALKILITSQKEYEKYSEKGLENVLQRFTPTTIAKQYLSLYNTSLKTGL